MNTFFRRPFLLILKDLILSLIIISTIIGIDRFALTYFNSDDIAAKFNLIRPKQSFYVSPEGSDNSTCQVASPCLTYAKAESLAQSGDVIYLSGFLGNIHITKSGTAEAPLTIMGQAGVTLSSLLIEGDYVQVYQVEITGAESHGIQINSKHVLVQDSIVHNSVTENGENNQCGVEEEVSWGSGLKIRVGAEDVTLRGNKVFHNCGEGIAITRGSNILVENNILGSNYSVGIYIDNSNNVTVQNNIVACDDTYLRNERRMSGIVIAAEFYEGWGIQLHDNKILNNIVSNCYDNIASWLTEDGSPTINLIIDGNISINAVRRSIDMDSISENIVVSNNLLDKPIYYDEKDEGLTLINNRVLDENP